MEDPSENKRMALKKLHDSRVYQWTIYTDGSAKEGCEEGEAAAVITQGPPENPAIRGVLRKAGGK